MKQTTRPLLKMLGAALALGFCSGCGTTQVETSTLKDTLIAVRDQALAAGASNVHYEASVVTTANGSLALVVPVVTSPTIGFGAKREVTSKVTVDIKLSQPTNDISETRGIDMNQTVSGERYLLDLKTLKAKPLK